MFTSDSLAGLPKADLHVHQEATRYLDLVLAEREGRDPYDWSAWRQRLAAEVPPGKERLQRIGSMQPVSLDHDNDDRLLRLVEAGVPVTLATDNPIQLSTTIEQEYTVAAGLGLSDAQLADVTRNAIRAAFTSDERKSAMLDELAIWCG
jgi:hypothetical protein